MFNLLRASLAFLILSSCASELVQTSDMSQEYVRASRYFAGPSQFPPEKFAAYGILAFPVNPAGRKENRKRFDLFCSAYISSFKSVAELEAQGIKKEGQMVTVLPISDDTFARIINDAPIRNACDLAVNHYGFAQAQDAIWQANRAASRTDGIVELDGRGPYLIAWSPGSTKGETDTIVLVADLSNSTTIEQIEADFRAWITDIQDRPELWRRGWNLEAVQIAMQRWIDRRAVGILQLLGDAS
ncbi:hypothetical protein [Martelella sp.]|uniref:hypothetical protein n=1 Tax=Martelella sp. TaxID=1969699 RepID=UPI0025C245B7|nr:hypothetical protein [Martelella sp.]